MQLIAQGLQVCTLPLCINIVLCIDFVQLRRMSKAAPNEHSCRGVL